MRALALMGGLILGLALGWAIATSGTGPGIDLPAPVSSTTIARAAPAHPFYVDHRETPLGTGVLVVDELTSTAGRISVRYELHSVAPAAELRIETPIAPAFPNRWLLQTTLGTFEGAVSFPTGRSVDFTVPEALTLDDVTGLRITSLMLPVPMDEPFVLAGDGGSAELVPGVRADLHRVIVQGEQTLVQVALSADPAFQTAELGVGGDGAGWMSSVTEAEGRPRWTLRFDGTEVPDPIPLRARGVAWVELEASIDVSLETGE